MSELAWLVRHDCDFSGAQSYLTPDRSHFLDMPVLMSPNVRQALKDAGRLNPVTERPPPWQIQTHIPLNFLPPKLLDTCKVSRDRFRCYGEGEGKVSRDRFRCYGGREGKVSRDRFRCYGEGESKVSRDRFRCYGGRGGERVLTVPHRFHGHLQ